MELRPHQVDTIDQIKHSIRKGNRRIMVGAATSFGKTILAAHILKSAAAKGNKGWMICDRIKLIEQSLEKFDAHGLNVGVVQGIHERHNPKALIQIASMQTLSRRSRTPEGSIFIIDEAHILYQWVKDLMKLYSNCIFIGLSATPYSKGLGEFYEDLIVPITPNQLIEQGYLCKPRYFIGKQPDLKGAKSKALPTGGSDFDPKSVESTDPILSGDIIKNWLTHGENSQTIAFCPTIAQSKWLVDQFNRAGITAEHIDGYMDTEDREALYTAHDRGEYKILSCSQLLNTGYDSPTTKCLIDCYPTKSIISFCQRVGRIMRTHESKEYCIYLDHAGNVHRHGRQEDIVPDCLHDGVEEYKERELTKEKKEPKVKGCPQCYQPFTGISCACGYEIPIHDQMENDGSELVELDDSTVAGKRNRTASKEDKEQFLAGLKKHARSKGFKDGWVNHTYRDYFSVWPNKIKAVDIGEIPAEVLGFIKHKNIKNAKRSAA